MTPWLAAAWLLLSSGRAAPEDARACATVVTVAPPPSPSIVAPPRPRQLTRVQVTVRPFLGLTNNTWGGVNDARVEHYFGRPFMVGLQLAPLAFAGDQQGPGAVTNLRLHAAYVTDYLAIGFGAGERFRRFGTSAVSLAPTLRLGALDGLNLSLEYVYAVARNAYTGRPTLGFSSALASVTVPVSSRVALMLDTGLSFDAWAFLTAGLRQRLTGDGGPGTWLVSGGFGLAWVLDRSRCDYTATVPCAGATAFSFGPTVAFGLERRL